MILVKTVAMGHEHSSKLPARPQWGSSLLRDARHHDRMSPPGRLRDRMSPPGGSVTDLASPLTAEVAARPTRRCVLDIVIPVHNEEYDLPGSVRRLHRFLVAEVPYPSRITIADNASTDNTLAVAEALAEQLSDVEVIHVDEKGRGGASGPPRRATRSRVRAARLSARAGRARAPAGA